MPKYSSSSSKKLKSCHPLLQLLMLNVVENFDNTIVGGHRGKMAQDAYYREEASKLKWPKSKHNKTPSLAVDAVPYIQGIGVVWEIRQCYFFSGYVIACANSLSIPVRTGADWNMNMDINDQNFRDVCHFELIKELI